MPPPSSFSSPRGQAPIFCTAEYEMQKGKGGRPETRKHLCPCQSARCTHSTGYKNTLKAFQFGVRGLIRDSLRFHCTRNYLICLQWIPQPPLHRSPTSCEGRILITAISNGCERCAKATHIFETQCAIALASWRTRVSHTEGGRNEMPGVEGIYTEGDREGGRR